MSPHLFGVQQRLEGNELGVRFDPDPVDDIAQGNADPGNDHGPGLDAAQPVDPLLQLVGTDQVLEIIDPGIVHGAFDGDDELLFHGRFRRAPSPTGERDHENEYGPTDTYWLSWGGDEPGLRFLEQDAAPRGRQFGDRRFG